MTTTPDFQDLTRQIEQVAQAHIAASHRAAVAALEDAFASASGAKRAPRVPRSGNVSRRRPAAEIAAVSERLFKAVCARPGEGMAVIAGEVGLTPRELHRPMAQLKRSGRVRSVGQRHLTRYFPMVSHAEEA